MKSLVQALQRLAVRPRMQSSLVAVDQMVSGDSWPRVGSFDDLLAADGAFPRLLCHEQPERLTMGQTLWREPSYGLDKPKAAEMFNKTSYGPAHAHIARFRDAAAFPASGLVMPAPGQLWAYSSWPARWGDPDLTKIPGMHREAGTTRFDRAAWHSAPQIKDTVALITTQFSNMYGHWLCDTVTGVIWLLPAIRDGRVRLLSRPLTDWQRAVLRHLEIADSSLIESDEPIVRCDDLLIASSLGSFDVGSPSLRQCYTFDALRQHGHHDGPTMIYIARDRIVRSRTMMNEADVIARLSNIGFTVVRPERMPFAEQVRTFSQARLICGAHGSGMANVGLAPPGCIVLEIMPEFWIQAWTYRLCALFGHRYVAHIAEVDPRSRRETAHDGSVRFSSGLWYHADVDRLEAQTRDIVRHIEAGVS